MGKKEDAINGRIPQLIVPIQDFSNNLNQYANLPTLSAYTILNPVISAFSKVSSSLTSAGVAFQNISNALLPFQSNLDVFSKLISDSFSAQAKFISDSFLRYQEKEKLYVVIMAKCGWAPPLGMPISFMKRCVDYYNDRGEESFQEYVDTTLVGYYSDEKLDEIRKHWISIEPLANRHRIFDDAITAHQTNLFNTSIPTLLTQIEGVIFEANNHHGWMRQDQIQKYIDIILSKNDSYSPIKGLILDELYKSFTWGDEVTKSLSRHAILHGADVEYGTRKNSLRIILLFDFLLYLIFEKQN